MSLVHPSTIRVGQHFHQNHMTVIVGGRVHAGARWGAYPANMYLDPMEGTETALATSIPPPFFVVGGMFYIGAEKDDKLRP